MYRRIPFHCITLGESPETPLFFLRIVEIGGKFGYPHGRRSGRIKGEPRKGTCRGNYMICGIPRRTNGLLWSGGLVW